MVTRHHTFSYLFLGHIDFFNQLFSCPRPDLGQWREGSLTHPMLNIALFHFRPKAHRKPCNKARFGTNQVHQYLNRQPADSKSDALCHCAAFPKYLPNRSQELFVTLKKLYLKKKQKKLVHISSVLRNFNPAQYTLQFFNLLMYLKLTFQMK